MQNTNRAKLHQVALNCMKFFDCRNEKSEMTKGFCLFA